MRKKPILHVAAAVLAAGTLLLSSLPGFSSSSSLAEPPQFLSPVGEHAYQETPAPATTPSPSLHLTPPSLSPEPIPERRPSLVVGAALIVAVILFGLGLNARRVR
jgi:hypothetical protein